MVNKMVYLVNDFYIIHKRILKEKKPIFIRNYILYTFLIWYHILFAISFNLLITNLDQ